LFEDESHLIKFDEKPYVVAMANYGPNTNASQFIFSLRTNAAFNGLFVGVGEILEGFHLFDDLEAIA
jgi:cyclophilin family peptidyl-prolyl cis-trans isomerase